uniref:Uncharacterized protein n=1 Tax=viral metagenome TaxID=1070528 RepID=A0A6M3LMW9_9ZZZZ
MTFENEIRIVKEVIKTLELSKTGGENISVKYIEAYKSILRILENLREEKLEQMIKESAVCSYTQDERIFYVVDDKILAQAILKGLKGGD